MEDKVESEEVRSKTKSAKDNTQSEKHKIICDRCGFEMYKKNCKVVCPNCGNRFDCSDLNIYFD